MGETARKKISGQKKRKEKIKWARHEGSFMPRRKVWEPEFRVP